MRDRLRKQLMLNPVNPLMQRLFGVANLHGDDGLGDDWTRINFEPNQMNAAPGDFHTCAQRISYSAAAFEARKQTGMEIDDAIGERIDQGRSADSHPAGHHYPIHLKLLQLLDGRGIKRFPRIKLPVIDDNMIHTQALCTGDSSSVRVVTDQRRDISIDDTSANCRHNYFKVRTTAAG